MLVNLLVSKIANQLVDDGSLRGFAIHDEHGGYVVVS